MILQYANREYVAQNRLAICRNCPQGRYSAVLGQCKECGCFMKIKTKIKSSECPLKNW